MDRNLYPKYLQIIRTDAIRLSAERMRFKDHSDFTGFKLCLQMQGQNPRSNLQNKTCYQVALRLSAHPSNMPQIGNDRRIESAF